MANFSKAAFVTLLTIAPVAAKELIGESWHWGWFAVYCLLVFGGYWRIVFRPDERFMAVRTPTLDNCFKEMFANVKCVGTGRFPFSVNVYRPLGFWRFPILLVVAYEWKGNPSDSDHGKWWWAGCGLVGASYRRGMVGFFRKGDDLDGYFLSNKEKEATNHLEALLCLPLRKPRSRGDERVSDRVTAVLAVNALSPEAAVELEEWYKEIEARKGNVLVDKAGWISLYF